MTSVVSAPSGLRNRGPMSRYWIVSPSANFAMSLLAFSFTWRRLSLGFAPRGKIASTSTFVFGSFSRSFSTILATPSAISSGVLSPELFVPIISTASFGAMPSMLPLSSRHRTCWVRSPPMPRLTALRLA